MAQRPGFALPAQRQPGFGTKSGKILGIGWENEGFNRFINTLNPDPSIGTLLLTKGFRSTAQPPARGVWRGAVLQWHRLCWTLFVSSPSCFKTAGDVLVHDVTEKQAGVLGSLCKQTWTPPRVMLSTQIRLPR